MPEFDNDGFNPGEPDTIKTWCGRRVNPLALMPADVLIMDIAHSLARQCRYQGHTGGFLSVARHSIEVSQYLVDHGRPDLALHGLLHDASEAYLGDVPRPMKHQREFDGYRKAEERADQAIAQVFGLAWPMPPEVHEADRRVLLDLELPNMRVNYDGNYVQDEEEFMERYMTLTNARLSPPTLIGLAGYARSGKDTVAAYLVEHHSFTRFAFADTLRDVLYALNPWVAGPGHGRAHHDAPWLWTVQELVDAIGWDKAKEFDPDDPASVRSYLQRLGTEAGRKVLGENIWVDTTMEKVEASGKLAVITDVRFPNEFDAVVDAGGEVWWVERPGTKPVNAHVSETALDHLQFDRVVGNDGSLLDLHHQLYAMLNVPGRVG